MWWQVPMDARRGYQIPGAGIVGDNDQHGWDLNSVPWKRTSTLSCWAILAQLKTFSFPFVSKMCLSAGSFQTSLAHVTLESTDSPNFPFCGNYIWIKILFLNDLFILILYALVFCLHVCLCEGVRFLQTRVTENCELLCGCWESSLSPLEEQLNHWTISPAPS